MTRARRTPLSTILALAVGLVSAIPAAGHAGGLMEAVSGGSPSLDLRYRYEMVDQTGIADTAQASTLRTRLGYATGAFHGAKAMVEFENIATIDGDEYNSTRNGKTGRPVVADPDGTELNRVALGYAADALSATVGRQRIIFDNARFVGNVGWRQNEQTFDAARLDYKASDALSASYAYLWNVNGIDFSDAAHDSHLLNVAYGVPKAGKLTAYGYLVNNDDAPATASQTLGLRYTGDYDVNTVKLGVTAEYAAQSEFAGSAIADSDYLFGELSGTAAGVTAGLGYEVLGGDGTSAFQTPLATKHAFNGWADKFLATPVNGLADLMLTVSGKVAGVKLVGVYHDFAADSGGTDYGTELDLLAAKKLGPHTLGVKYASYSADSLATDTDKLWLFAETAF
ncbi:MAG: alginate export family protein [Nitrospirae bacterium]|nr:alginate export family protein [Nitrospirota bacterium]